MKCEICKKEYKTNNALGIHIKKSHNISTKDYYDLYLKKNNEGICPICRKETIFIDLSQGYRKHCSSKCSNSDPETIKKQEETFKNHFNCKRPAQNKAILTKMQNTCEELYGAKNGHGKRIKPQNTTMINTWTTRYENISKFETENNCTFIKRITDKYNSNIWHQLKLPLISYKTYHFIDNKYLNIINEFMTSINGASDIENSIINILKAVYSGKIYHNFKDILKPYELDIYLPEFKLAIEYNGIYWHSIEFGKSKDYHLMKSLLCKDKEIRLIHIYEFENLEEQLQLLKDLITGVDNYPKNDFNKNNLINTIPNPEIIYSDNKFTIYGAGKLI